MPVAYDNLGRAYEAKQPPAHSGTGGFSPHTVIAGIAFATALSRASSAIW